MNIGIDIDGVLLDFEREAVNLGTKMSVEENWPIDIDLSAYWDIQIFNWNDDQAKKFWDKYFIRYLTESPVREFAPEVIEKLQQEGDKIYLITARNEEELPVEHYGKMKQLTKDWLKFHNIKYEKLIFVEDKEKLPQCLENDVAVMIEDSPSNIQNISKQIKVIKYDCQYNKEVNGKNIITAYSWYHIYDIINKLKNNRQNAGLKRFIDSLYKNLNIKI